MSRLASPGAHGLSAPDNGGRSGSRGSRWLTGAVLAGWVTLLAVSVLVGRWLVDAVDHDLNVRAVPLYGVWEPLLTWRLGLPVAAGVLGVALLPRLAATLSWRWSLAGVGGAAVLWSAALAAVDPPRRAWESIHEAYGQHTGLVGQAGGPGAFLGDYVAQQPDFPIHLQSHPPGMVLLLWALPSGVAVEVVLALLAVAAGAVAALVVLREVAGEPVARAAAPFVVLAPAAVWHTNADVIFAGVGLVGVALAVVATGRHGRRSDLVAAGGGLALGVALLLSYGVALLAVPVLVVALWRLRSRSVRVVVVTGAVAIAVAALPALWGFWWVDGLEVTRQRYYAGIGGERPHWYFLFANLAVFALAVGPAVAVALARLRSSRVWVVVGGALAAVALADLSGMSSGETERIWQPFMPLALLAGCALAGPRVRWWLGLQVVVAVVLQAVLRSPW